MQTLKDKTALVAPCGVYCGVCPVYRADKENLEALKRKIAASYGVKREEVFCDGCRSCRVFLGDGDCTVKPCALAKDLAGCYACDDFPCSRIEERPDFMRRVILRSVPILKTRSVESFIENEERHYRCPQCGTRLYMGARKCPSCGLAVDLEAG